MINKKIFSIFQKGSRTYFYSSLFFPTYLKKDVFTLYGFVRKADNYVDSIPQNTQGFYDFKKEYYKTLNGEKTDDVVINSFVKLLNEKQFEQEWVDAFLKSMDMDINKTKYETIKETLEYIYGSAEVIGLMMAKIMDLPGKSYYYAKMLARAMQYINFIRDIAEDVKLGRIYFPSEDLRKHDILKLDYKNILKNTEGFTDFIHKQLGTYCKWQKTAEEGFKYIPKRYLIPVKTASEMYHWTAEQIYKNPFIVYDTKIKPMISKILTTTIMNIIEPRRNKNIQLLCLNKKPTPQINYQ
jgi:phytoene synthase